MNTRAILLTPIALLAVPILLLAGIILAIGIAVVRK